MENQKKVMLSDIQPSGKLHLGNYLGTIKGQGARTGESDCFYFMADVHTITVRQTPAELRRRTLGQVAQCIACGLDPEHNTIFVQSHVHQYAELTWVLECYTMFGELSRMAQFRDKSARHVSNINADLFTYPCLTAADILLYQPDLVSVGGDQKQHMELTHNVAQHFNHVYGDALKVPEPYVPKMGARVTSLNQPDTKISKSIPEGCMFLMDRPKNILRRFKRTITDSNTERCVRFDQKNKLGVSGLANIYSAVTGRNFEAIGAEFDDKGYGVLRPMVGEAVVEMLRPIQEETRRLLSDKAYLERVHRVGVEKASYVTEKALHKVYRRMDFLVR